jgi:ABC-type molybdate transport system substrate-binding protein
LAGLALVVAGCGGKAPTEKQPPAPGKETISIMVPCGQVGPFNEVVKAWEKQNPGVELNWVPENMVTIVKKILDGKETPDVVLTMGDLEMDKLEQAGALLEGTRAKIAENALAITTPGPNPAKVKGIADLAKPAVKMISIPNPEYNSVGKHAIEALKAAGIWAQVEIGYYPCVTEVHVPGQSPAKPKNLNLVGMIPQNLYTPFSCEAAVLKKAKNPEGGKELLALLQSPEAHEFYVEWSFVNQEPPKPVAGE